MAQPDPVQTGNQLHAAADQAGLPSTLSVDPTASILQKILDEIEHLCSDITRLESKLAIVDHNTQVRIYNSILTSCHTPLKAIKTFANTVPASFPVNTEQLAEMSDAERLALSRAYDLPEDETAEKQHMRFRRFVGVMRFSQ